eukprot:snap_masked-scaffold_22-processed-gene-5.38-mRNA-1 protein AED:0.03 eAED:0.03 QI:0/-1/0/1/-1/1/1/0/313
MFLYRNREQTSSPNPVKAFSAPTNSSSPLVPRIMGSAVAGVSELCLFHPVDTVAKRLMSNKSSDPLSKVIFKENVNASTLNKWKSLFPGFGFAAGYKILQRIYKFSGQIYVKDWINKTYGESLQAALGKKSGKTLSSSIAGSIMGVGEIVLLPLDVLKIKSQTNPEVLKGRGVVDIFVKENVKLYRGAGWTAARNAPGSFALFGGSAFMQYLVFGLEETKDATVFQNFCASIVGSVCSITVAAPLDVVKTRIQNKAFNSQETGVKIIRDLVREEGFSAFFKGLTPKILVAGPKLIFSFTVAQTMIAYFERKMK